MNLDISQIIIQIIAFLLMLWVLKRYGWKPLTNQLDDRQAKIKGEFDAIAAERQAVQNLKESYEEKLRKSDDEARRKIQEGIGQGRRIALEIEEQAQANSRAILERVRREARNEIDQAKDQLKSDIVQLVIATTEKVLQKELDPPKQEQLIRDLIEKAKL